jgi:hypothetical protein
MEIRGPPVGDKYAAVLIDCLTSSKSETRSIALSLIEASVDNGLIGLDNIKKATDRLKPALQRSVGPLIANIAKKSQPPVNAIVSNLPNECAQKATKSGDRRPRLNSKDHPDTSAAQISRRKVDDNSPSKSTSHQPLHPLVPDSGRHASGVSRIIIWTEYPEEPHGSILENLKRGWALILPSSSVTALFPNSGIRKQDDAKSGIELLTRAISVDRRSGSVAVVDQLDVILKWLMFALCSKESTTGLVDILALWKDLFCYLLEVQHELSDSEAIETVPLLLDKASGAKVGCLNAKCNCSSINVSSFVISYFMVLLLSPSIHF